MIKNVIFDIGQVLTSFSILDYFKGFGYSEEMSKRLADATMHSSWWCELDRGVFSNEEILSFFISEAPELEADIRKTLTHMTGLVKPKETAIPWIRSLKERGYHVYYLSNFSDILTKDCPESLAFLPETDGGILSFRDQMIKPNPDIYQLLLQRYGLTADQCVFIDDTRRNLPIAEKLGIHTIWYRTQEQAEAELEEMLK